MKERAVLIDIVEPDTTVAQSKLRLDELESLVKTYGGISVLKTLQKRSRPDYRTYVGRGKVKEILDEMQGSKNIDVIILNNILKPKQVYNLEEFCVDYEIEKQKEEARFSVPKKIKVWDRVDLILKIFDKHATSAEAKLQIELAGIRHMGPRIFGMGLELSRQAGGIGTVGVGETNIEIMKRHLQKRLKFIENKIINYGEIQSRQRESRRQKSLKTVALAGYTNAGKSSLIKALTKKKEVYIADELFATLDSKVGELYLENSRQKVMVADTIGFIQDLPPSLIKAFKTTLAEIVDADLILHVIDINDSNIHFKIEVVEKILTELALEKKIKSGDNFIEQKKIYIFNKLDLLEKNPWALEDKSRYIDDLKIRYADYKPRVLSALKHDGLKGLVDEIESFLTNP